MPVKQLTPADFREMTNQELVDHLGMLTQKITTLWGQHPDAHLLREVQSRVWLASKEEEKKPAPKKTTPRKGS